MLEIRDTSWYKAKAKEIDALRTEIIPLPLRITMYIRWLEQQIINSRPLPRFKEGGVKPIQEVVLTGSEGLFRNHDRVIRIRPRHATSLSRQRCNM